MKRLGLLVLLVVLGFLTACQPGPEEYARADQIRAETRAKEVAAQQAARERELELQRKQAETQTYIEALQEGEQQIKSRFLLGVNVLSFLLIGSLAAILVALTVYLVPAIRGTSKAYVQRADLVSKQILIDRDTRTYPLIQNDGRVVNPNTGLVLETGQAHDPYPTLTQADHHIRVTGLLAEAAAEAGKRSKEEGWQAADALPGIAQGVPFIDVEEIAPDENLLVDNIRPRRNRGRVIRNGGRDYTDPEGNDA